MTGGTEGAAGGCDPLLEVRDLVKEYPAPRGRRGRGAGGVVQAVSGVSLALGPGETLGLVGESGCGKSTLVRAALQLERPTSGQVLFRGRDLTALTSKELRPVRRELQVVFQDPSTSLDPRLPVGEVVAEAFKIHGSYGPGGAARVAGLLDRVGLPAQYATRYPHELSGGQRQRVAIARAIALDPAVVLLDEPLSSLDVSVQAGIVNLLQELQAVRGMAYLFVAHDLSMVRHVSDRVAVMYLGTVVETGTRAEIYEQPRHPYTRALLSAMPVPNPARERARERIVLNGEAPSAADPPSGCRFRTRCWKAQALCAERVPSLGPAGGGHRVACHFPEEPPVPAATALPVAGRQAPG